MLPHLGVPPLWRTSLIHRVARRRMPARRGMGSVGTASMSSVSGGTAMALRRALAGLLAAPALVLAGCGGDSSVADPPVQSSPTSSATSDPPAHETAEHFIRRWAEAEKQMENTGKTADYLALSRRCRSCRALADRRCKVSTRHGGFVQWGVGGSSRIKDVSRQRRQRRLRDAARLCSDDLQGVREYAPTDDFWRVATRPSHPDSARRTSWRVVAFSAGLRDDATLCLGRPRVRWLSRWR